VSSQSPSGSNSLSLLDLLVLAVCVAGLAVLAAIPLDWQQQVLVSGALLLAALWADRASRDYKVTVFLMLCSLFCTGRYLWFRASETWNFLLMQGPAALDWDLLFVFLLLGAEFYAALILALGFFQGVKVLDRKPVALPADLAAWPMIDVFIPTYNEPLDVVKPTVLAALNMDYPADRFTVHILDDGTRDEFRELAAVCGAGYIVREEHKHAKAGNINNALRQTRGELVAIFDCDHIPTRSFLQMTAGWFLRDPKLAMLQTPHFFYSPDPFERNLGIFRQVPNEGYLFYGLVQAGNDFWNATFFCGSCALMRREALDEIGGIAVETVTEDAHTSLRMQRNGWNTSYINLPQAAGLATACLADHIGQRIRWARGMVQILRIDLPLLGRGLSLAQRLCYFNSTVHYLFAVPRLIFLTAPLVHLLLGRINMYGYVVTILAYAVPHLLFATLTNSRLQGRYRHSFWNEVYETVLAPYILMPTLAALINPKWGKFNVTSKSTQLDRGYVDWRIARPFIALLLLNAAGIGMGLSRLGNPEEQVGTILVNVAWALLNIVNLGAAIAVASESRQLRSTGRIPAALKVNLCEASIGEVEAVTVDVSSGGLLVAMPAPWHLAAGDVVHVGFVVKSRAVQVPAAVVACEGKSLRLAFQELSLEQEEDLAQYIYARGDAWLHARDTEVDRPWRSFLSILTVSARGILSIPRALFGFSPGVRRAPRPVRQSASGVLTPGRSVASVLFLVGALLALAALQARAQTAPREFSDVQELRALGVRQPLSLRGVNGSASVAFSMPLTKVATDASLTLQITPAVGLHAEASSLAVALNGSDVATIGLKAEASGVKSIISLPAELLMSENTLTFTLSGRCDTCTAPQEAALRTTIDPASSLRVDGRLLPFSNDLRLLPLPLFDASSNRPLRLNFVFLQRPDAKVLESAGMLASWFGTLADFRGAHFPVTVGEIPPGHAVLLLDGKTPPQGIAGLADLTGSGVAMRDNPADPYGKLLIVYGEDAAKMQAAARMLVARRLQGETAALTPVSLAARAPYDAPRWLRSGQASRFGGFAPGEQLHLHNSGATRIYFRLAPDLYYGSRVSVPLRLQARFAGVPAAASAHLRVKLNGALVAERKLPGDLLKRPYAETLQLSVAQLYPRNTLTFEVDYKGAEGAATEMTILPESEIDLRGVSHFVEQPRLDLFAKAGYPFTREPDLGATAVVLPPAASANQVGLYLNLMAFFGAQTGVAASRVTVAESGQSEQLAGKDLLVLGAGPDQPLLERWASRLPVRLDGQKLRMSQEPSRLQWAWDLIRTGQPMENRPLADVLSMEAPVDSVLQGIVSPADGSRVMIALSTASSRDAEALVRLLDQSAYNEDVYGSVALEQAGRFQSFRAVANSIHSGRLDWMEALQYWVRRYAWLIPIFVLCAGFGIASRLELWVSRQTEMRLRA
jgi:cellulose synthase (UDP-forming)